MNAAESFVASRGRGGLGIADVALWLGRSVSYVYRLIGRGDLQSFGPGQITADSLIRFYAKHDEPVQHTAPRRLAGVR